MKKAVRKGASKAAALVLSLAMIFGMVPLVGASAEETAGAQDNFDRIVHLDMGRKYFTPEWIKSLIDEMAKLGYNQLELDFGNSEAGQLRFALKDMSVTYTYDEYTMVPVDSVSEEEPAAPAETGAPEEEPAAPAGTGAPEEEPAAPAETGAPEEEPAAPAGTGAPEEEPAAPVSDEVLEQAETNGNGSGVIEYRYSKTPKTKTIDLSKALSSESPEGEYITEEQMADIITYANEKDIEIVPLLNSPGHFGAVLCAADADGKNYRYQRYDQGTNSLNIADPEARAFGLAVVEKYAKWFKEKGCDTFNIGADEFANDSGIMGFSEFNDEMWSYFDSYITGLYNMLTDGLGYTTVRMLNDGVNYGPDDNRHGSNIPKDIQICYWSSGWDGYDVAPASKLASQYSLINTNGEYYFVLKDGTMEYKSEEECLRFANESFMGGTVSSSAGSMFCIWCDEPKNATQEEIMEAVKGPMTAVAYQMQGGASGTGLSYEVFKTYGANADVSYTKEEDIYLNVGGTQQRIVDGNVTSSTSPDESIASVETVYTPFSEPRLEAVTSIESGQQYIIANNRAGKVLTDSSVITIEGRYDNTYGLRLDGTATAGSQELWTITASGGGYTVQNTADSYLKVGEDDGAASVEWRSQTLQLSYNGGAWTIAQTYRGWFGSTTTYLNDYGGHGTAAGGWSDSGAATDAGSKWTIYRIVEGQAEDATTITFTGVGVGETSVIIGYTKYNITVVAEDLSHVTPLTVEYWITNAHAKDVNGDTSVEISAERVYGPDGVAVTELVPETALKADNERELVYWKVRILPYGSYQYVPGVDDPGGDYSDKSEVSEGTDIAYIRYQGGNWQGYTEDGTWVNIADTNQVVAYYMFKSDVTEEVTTAVKDWGITSGGDWGYSPEQYRSVITYQLVLEDGTTYPVYGSNDFINKNSMIFHNVTVGGRVMGSFMVLQDGSYDVARITATNGEVSIKTSGNYVSIRDLEYPVDDPNAEVTLWEGSSTEEQLFVDTTALEGEAADAVRFERNSDDAILIRIYVKPKIVSANLQVQYLEEGQTSPFHTVSYVATSPENFSSGFVSDGMLIMDGNGQSTATIMSESGREQHVNSRLEQLPTIPPQYKYLEYELVRAEVDAEDPTILKLYYTIEAAECTFVADYGLSMVIGTEEFGIPSDAVNSISIQGSGMGELEVNGKQLVYQMSGMSPAVRRFSVIVNFSGYSASDGTWVDGGTATYSFEVVPDSTVYYEAEGFVKSTNGTWQTAGTPGNRTQAADKLGDPNANNYGSDTSYDSNALGSSNGAALKTAVAPSGTGEDTTWPEATFTFTGTGVDIISQTDSASTWLLVEVKNDNGEPKCAYLVNNYYSAKNAGVNTIYQVPVIKVQGLACDTYNVTVKPFYDTNEEPILAVEGQAATEFNFYLDAIRVYNPLGESGDTYYTEDGEANAQFINLSKYVTGTTENGLWVDENTGANVNIYKDDGPNNEIYLAPGQSVTINLVDSEGQAIATTEGKSAQIGAHLMNGTNDVQITVGGQTITVDSTVDQYYEVTGGVDSEITITNNSNGSGIVALTTLKLTGGSN